MFDRSCLCAQRIEITFSLKCPSINLHLDADLDADLDAAQPYVQMTSREQYLWLEQGNCNSLFLSMESRHRQVHAMAREQ